MKPSKYQIDFWDAIEHTKDNIAASSVPGGGKSTALVGGMKRIPKYKSAISVSFSKQLQEDIKPKLPSHIESATLHSIGYAILRSHSNFLKLNGFKSCNFADPLTKDLLNEKKEPLSYKEKLIYKFTVSDLIDKARINMDTSLDGFKYAEKNYDIICKNGEVVNAVKAFDAVQKYNRAKRRKMDIDYVDMLYLPLSLNLNFPKYDYVFYDEGQDASILQIEFLKRLLKPNGRLIVVFDPLQAIYNFAGASSKSIEILQKDFNLKLYPLSVTYRVPKSGVELLKEINPNIECPDNAIEGSVRHGNLSEVQAVDLVICRNTKPLIIAYFNLIAQEKKATIVGKEFESGLSKLINKFDGMNIKTAKHCIEQEKQYIEEQLKDQGITEPKKHFKYVSFKEKTDVLEIFFNKYDSIPLVKTKIADIFNEGKLGIKLMTVHKSKGLESHRVFFITHLDGVQLIPSKYAKSDEQKQQETNLKYVAMSRHKKELIFVKLNEND